MQKFLASTLVLCLSFAVFGQYEKVSMYLFDKLSDETFDRKTEESVMVRGDIESIRFITQKHGGHFKYAVNNIASVRVNYEAINEMMLHPQILRIEDGHALGLPLADEMRNHNNVNKVHAGVSPLPQSYRGQGVVVGVIDLGIDFDHPDFSYDDGTSRVKHIWDQNKAFSATYTPMAYGYGQAWDSTQIANGECSHSESSSSFSHGSAVAGAAVGDGSGINKYWGMAPEAEIVVVSIKSDASFLNNVADAVKWIFEKADAMGLPCVVNTSVGTYSGSHDAQDLSAQIIEGLLDAKAERVVVAAAGNAGHEYFHLSGPSFAPNFSWFEYYSGAGFCLFEVWADTAEWNKARFSFGADNPTNWNNYGRTVTLNPIDDFPGLGSGSDSRTDNLVFGGTNIGTITTTISLSGGTYKTRVVISTDSTNLWWRFINDVAVDFDIWSKRQLTVTSDIVHSPLPSTSEVADIGQYVQPDSFQSIVSSWQCSDKVITVANYQNRSSIVNVEGDIVILGVTPGQISETSSLGPTRDGRTKPDISAPGGKTITPGDLHILAAQAGLSPDFVVFGGMHMTEGGTSMASPGVAGAAALVLEAFPGSNWERVKNLLIHTARQDAFTGSGLPDNQWGFGKLDAFSSLTETVYGCTDYAADNFDPDAEVDDGSCSFSTHLQDLRSGEFFRFAPNPSQGSFKILSQTNLSGASVSVHDIHGKLVMQMDFPDDQTQIDLSELGAGLYLVKAERENQILGSGKVLIQ